MDLETKVVMKLISVATTDLDMDVTPSTDVAFSYIDSLADGTAANQADIVWFDAATQVADATDDIDLAGGVTDVFGSTITMARAKCLFFKNTSTTASVLEVGPHADAAGWQAGLTSSGGATGNEARSVSPGAAFMIWAPGATAWAIGGGATDVLEVFESSSLASAYEIAVVGATA